MLNVQDKRGSKAATSKAPPARAGAQEARLRIAEDIGQTYARYGLAMTVGRVFGLLLASDEPLSLDDIAVKLKVSKSGVSLAARDLERVGIARRLGTSGSRRVLYEATDTMETSFDATFARIRDSLHAMERAEALLPAGRARQRLRLIRDVHEFWLREIDGIKDRWRHRRSGR